MIRLRCRRRTAAGARDAAIVRLRGAQEPLAAARAHLDDPRTIAVSGLLFLVWGRKPAGSAA
jgi:hypothetical protein